MKSSNASSSSSVKFLKPQGGILQIRQNISMYIARSTSRVAGVSGMYAFALSRNWAEQSIAGVVDLVTLREVEINNGKKYSAFLYCAL
jgi:hypothetical protein